MKEQPARVCTVCRTPAREGRRFCHKCGAQIAPDPIPPLRDEPEGAPSGRGWVLPAITVAVVAVVLGALALAGSRRPGPDAPEPTTPQIVLTSTSVPELGFALQIPDGWSRERLTLEEDRDAMLWWDPRTGTSTNARRGFNVILDPASLERARAEVEGRLQDSFEGYRSIGFRDDLHVGGRRAFLHEFVVDTLRFDQWWVERTGGQAFRLTFWAPVGDHPRARAVHEEISGSFREL